jgi:hypothetical protein
MSDAVAVELGEGSLPNPRALRSLSANSPPCPRLVKIPPQGFDHFDQ